MTAVLAALGLSFGREAAGVRRASRLGEVRDGRRQQRPCLARGTGPMEPRKACSQRWTVGAEDGACAAVYSTTPASW